MLTVTNLKIQGENMDKIQLFRRRYIPDEIKELKDDIVLSVTDDMILTKWNVLKPRKDIARGVSAYFIDKGIKVSKVYDSEEILSIGIVILWRRFMKRTVRNMCLMIFL